MGLGLSGRVESTVCQGPHVSECVFAILLLTASQRQSCQMEMFKHFLAFSPLGEFRQWLDLERFVKM